ncbi:hypothetical protein CMT45_02380 [Elizabethkingia anophelis]|nr:hypothetical protein [Elizabethkingia anophelis]
MKRILFSLMAAKFIRKHMGYAAKVFTVILMFSVVALGIKQGLSMINAQPEMVVLFNKFNYDVAHVQVYGILTIICSVLVLFPQTYSLGNVAMAITILFIAILQVCLYQYLKALIEVPFLLLNVWLIYLKYPFKSLLL